MLMHLLLSMLVYPIHFCRGYRKAAVNGAL